MGKKNKKDGRRQWKRFISSKTNKTLNKLIPTIFIVLILVVFTIMYGNSQAEIERLTSVNNKLQEKLSDDNHVDTTVMLEIPQFEEKQILVHNEVVDFMESDGITTAVQFFKEYHNVGKRLDVGKSVLLDLDLIKKDKNRDSYVRMVEISTNTDFSNSQIFEITHEQKVLEVQYLETGCKYYCRYTLSTGEMLTISFYTEDTPRILSIEGLVNVRDIGGMKTIDGKRIRQGLLYRGSEMDAAVEPEYKLTDAGRNVMLTVLGIRYDMDLRSPKDHVAGLKPLGANVEHKYYDAVMYGEIFDSPGRERTAEIFHDLAKRELYPMYLHCTYGLDRTGTICYLLEGLLGVSEADAIREYELSTLYYRGNSVDEMKAVGTILKGRYPADSLKDSIAAYLMECGVTENEIDTIRSIFLVQASEYN